MPEDHTLPDLFKPQEHNKWWRHITNETMCSKSGSKYQTFLIFSDWMEYRGR